MTRQLFESFAVAFDRTQSARDMARDAYARAALAFARAQLAYFDVRHKPNPEFGEYSAAFRKFSDARSAVEKAWYQYQEIVSEFNRAIEQIERRDGRAISQKGERS